MSNSNKNIKLIILVGLPGSGKSTFSKLIKTSSKQVSVINQDELGRKECQKIFLSEIKKNEVTVLDRCNLSKSGRAEWIKDSMLNSNEILCVHLATDVYECIQRAKSRKNHPTIKEGGGERIILEANKKFEVPEKSENFGNIVTLYDEEDVRNYLKTWDCSEIEIEEEESDDPSKFYKFPRTRHLINLGSATRDDLLVDFSKDKPSNSKSFNKNGLKSYFDTTGTIEICEKVDGAQMGFSMDENYQILVQNRSHYVNSKSHKQFKMLDKWLANFSGDLYEILQDNNHILFGEWLYAKHSVEYQSLPNYFLAFDLFNKKESKFYSREILEERLKGTAIEAVGLVYSSRNIGENNEENNETVNKEFLLKLMKEQSSYGDEIMEGVYIKICEDGWVKNRSKIVRSDFIAGNEHWSKGIITMNQLTDYF